MHHDPQQMERVRMRGLVREDGAVGRFGFREAPRLMRRRRGTQAGIVIERRCGVGGGHDRAGTSIPHRTGARDAGRRCAGAPCYNPRPMRRTRAVMVALLGIGTGACARLPATPPALPPPVTRLYQQPYLIVWDTVRVELNNTADLELDTIDKAGRFVAWEPTNTLFLLLARRNVVTVTVEPLGEQAARMVLQMSAQKYDTGGWSRPAGWYPYASVNEQLGMQIAGGIDRRLGHAPGLADRMPVGDADDGAAPVPDE